MAERTGDAVGGLLNATLGNLTELVIALTALQAGQYLLVKASIAGAIVTNTLFMLGGAFLIGGLRHHEQQFNRVNARIQSSLLFLATVALLVPSLVARRTGGKPFTQPLSLGLAVLLIVAYALSMVFSLKTHKEAFASVGHGEAGERLADRCRPGRARCGDGAASRWSAMSSCRRCRSRPRPWGCRRPSSASSSLPWSAPPPR